MNARLENLLTEMKKKNFDSALVTSTANFYYLSNYYTEPHERVIAVYVSENINPIIVIPAMEAEDAKDAGWKDIIISYHDHENPWQLLGNYLKENNKLPKTLAIEHNHFTLERYQLLKDNFTTVEIVDLENTLANLRVIKSKKEYTLLKQAAQLADFGVETGVKAIQEGITELEVIAKIEYELKKQGIQEMSFTTMCLSGTKTASPHGTPGMKKITAGDIVLFDLGVIFEGYCSDITRTVAYKSISSEQERIYNTVLGANRKGIEASVSGTPVNKVDLASRQYIENAGFGEYFNHRIGHGLGIETHEYPSMSSDNELPLKEGMSFTIEPGIYIPGTGGVRIEDMIFMTKNGAEILTAYPKELQIIE